MKAYPFFKVSINYFFPQDFQDIFYSQIRCFSIKLITVFNFIIIKADIDANACLECVVAFVVPYSDGRDFLLDEICRMPIELPV